VFQVQFCLLETSASLFRTTGIHQFPLFCLQVFLSALLVLRSSSRLRSSTPPISPFPPFHVSLQVRTQSPSKPYLSNKLRVENFGSVDHHFSRHFFDELRVRIPRRQNKRDEEIYVTSVAPVPEIMCPQSPPDDQ